MFAERGDLWDLGDAPGVEQHWFSLVDAWDESLAPAFKELLPIIARNVAAKRPVLVHCHAGISRSASIVLAYLVQAHGLSLAAAWDKLSARRKVAPNSGFWKQLVAFEAECVAARKPGDA